MACSELARVHQYYDGELSSAERAAEDAHVRDCVECRQALADLRRLSSLISSASLADVPVETWGRLHGCWRAASDRSVLHAAGWLTAAAAAVLVGALLAWPLDGADVGARPVLWETVAVTPPRDANGDLSSELVVMAQWMADELSSGEKR